MNRLIAFPAALVFILGCGAPGRDAATDGAPRVVIATDAAFPPFHYLDDAGRPTGHDVELAREAARRAGMRVEVIVVRPYVALFDGLTSGRHQIVAATTGITPERQQLFRMSMPYFDTCQAFLVRAGPAEPRDIAELGDKLVGALGDGTAARAVKGLSGVRPVRLRLEKGEDAIPALLNKEIDALVTDEFEAVAAARKQPDKLRVLAEPAALESYALVMPADRADLHAKINQALRGMQADGTMQRLREQFGVQRGADWPVKLPGR